MREPALRAFWNALAPSVRDSWTLEDAREVLVQAGLGSESEPCLEFIAERLEAPAFSNSERLADLRLAYGCSQMDPAALRALQSEHQDLLSDAVRRVPDQEVADLVVHLVAPRPGKPPRIASYGGRGSFRSWLEVVCARWSIDRSSAAARSRDRAETLAAVASQIAWEPETTGLRHAYRERFEAVLAAALEDLEVRHRNMLRLHYLEMLSSTRIAAMYGQHRSTVNRRLTEAKDALFEGVQARLMSDVGLSKSEVMSVLRMIGASLQVSKSAFAALAGR